MKHTLLVSVVLALLPALFCAGCEIGLSEFAEVTTFAGIAGDTGSAPSEGINGNVRTGGAEVVTFNRPEVMTYHDQYIYIGDSGNRSIRRIRVSSPPGQGNLIGEVETIYTAAAERDIRGIAVDKDGNIIFSDHHGLKIKKLRALPGGGWDTENPVVYGSGRGDRDGPGDSAQFNYPCGVAVDNDGNIYVADMRNYKIRKIDSAGNVSTFAGSGVNGYVDGKGAAAVFKEVMGLVLVTDADGRFNYLVVADSYNQTLRYIDAEGNTGTYVSFIEDGWGFKDGAAGVALGGRPQQLFLDTFTGNIYFTDRENAAVRMVTPGYVIYAPHEEEFSHYTWPIRSDYEQQEDGTYAPADPRIKTEQRIAGRFVTTIAGFRGFSRDSNNFMGHGYRDGNNVEARFSLNRFGSPGAVVDGTSGVAVTPRGEIYVADTHNHVIRRIVRN